MHRVIPEYFFIKEKKKKKISTTRQLKYIILNPYFKRNIGRKQEKWKKNQLLINEK